MGKTTEQRKQMEAIFVPSKGINSIEFAGVFEKDSDCDIHGNRRPSGTKRDTISFPIGLSKRDSADSILRKRESVDRELSKNGIIDSSYNAVPRRRSSGGKVDNER